MQTIYIIHDDAFTQFIKDMKILICTTEFPPYGSGIANVVYIIRTSLENVEDISTTVVTRRGGDINLGNNVDTLPGFIGRLYFWKKILNFILKNGANYDIIWLHSPLFMGANILKYMKRVIITLHSTYYGNFNAYRTLGITSSLLYYTLASKLEYIFLKNLSSAFRHNTTLLVTTMSPITAMQLKENGLSIDVEIIPNGVDINMFKPVTNKRDLRKHYGIPEDDLVFAFVGRIASVKQPFRLIKYFSKVNQILNNTTLIIVGQGELFNDLKRFTIAHSCKNVKFLGYIHHQELPTLYACSDLYLSTSIYEGQPLTLLEAMACGLPPLVSDIPNLRKIVNESKAGLLLDFSDEEEALKKTYKFIKEEDLQNQSRLARRYIEDNHDWKKLTAQYIQLFSKVTSNF